MTLNFTNICKLFAFTDRLVACIYMYFHSGPCVFFRFRPLGQMMKPFIDSMSVNPGGEASPVFSQDDLQDRMYM